MDTLTIFMVISNILIMSVIIGIFYFLQKKYVSFTKRVFLALGIGIIFGIFIQYFYGSDSLVTKETINWFDIIGNGYVKLLKMIVIPLVMISIISAIIKLTNTEKAGSMSLTILFVLIFTAGIASIIGIFIALLFGLTAEGLQSGTDLLAREETLNTIITSINKVPFTKRIYDIIPENPFADMAGLRPTSTIAVVIFSAFIGVASLGIHRKKPESFEFFKKMISSIQDIVLRIVTLILRLTPYAIVALMSKILATSNILSILSLGKFIIASYVALLLAILMHMILLSIFGFNPFKYIKKSIPLFTFAFTSRSSMGSIPLNIETQVNKFGVSEGIASLSASLGASIGQNGCAAIYPAMLAIMIAPTQGINPTDIWFLLNLIGIIIITSFGIAGSGGGATIASLMVLSSLNFPIALVGILISIEPLIDMGRTVINVSDSMVAGIITAKKLKQIDTNTYNEMDAKKV